MYTSFTASEEALVKATDKALYAAKSAGKNNYKVLSV
jgi:PleD family two-component response regulator